MFPCHLLLHLVYFWFCSFVGFADTKLCKQNIEYSFLKDLTDNLAQ